MLKRFLAIAFFLIIVNLLKAIDPVTVIVTLTPPYSPFLNEYGANGGNRMQVTLIINDSRMQNYPARLQMFVENVNGGVIMQTSEYAAVTPLVLVGNTTEVLQGEDLAPYFLAPNNTFLGFDRNQYIQTGRIPDGQYRIGFRVVDSRRSDVILSNTAYTSPGWFLLNIPPTLNLPRNKAIERVSDPQSVKLEWFPKHMGSMNSAFSTKYKIEVFAIRVSGLDPNQIALSTLPDFSDETTQKFYFLSNENILLEPGVTYAWRIKAFADEGLTVFSNNGYSEVYAFTYGNVCPVPGDVSSEVLGTEKAKISWYTDPLQTSYEVRYRVKNQPDAIWHTQESFQDNVTIDNLLVAGQSYDYQVMAKCNTSASDYSLLASFSTPLASASKFSCGALDTSNITNQQPKASLNVGEIIYSGKYPIKLTEVSGGNGTFTGKGYMLIPFFNYLRINMKFTNIKVNEKNEVYQGDIVSIYNPNSRFLIDDVGKYFTAGDQGGNVITGQAGTAITVNYTVDNSSQLQVQWTGNTVTITGPSGEVTTATVETSTGGVTVSDAQGNLYAVDSQGTVTQVGKTPVGAGDPNNYASNVANYNKLDNEAVISFSNNTDDYWAFDEYNSQYEKSTTFTSEYEDINGYKVPWKLVPFGKSGKVYATITKGNFEAGKIKFKTPAGTEYNSEFKDGKFAITIVSGKENDAQEIFALYQETESSIKSLGKLKVATYKMQTPNAVLVPIDQNNIDESAAKAELNKVYLPYGIEWKVKVDDPFMEKVWDSNNNGLDVDEQQLFSMYTDEMKALNDAYSAARPVDNNTVYLFVLNKPGGYDQASLQGDMPISSRFGYMFSNNISNISKTIAHELGHGTFQLKHTFDNKYNIDKGTTNNLMDYSDGLALTKYQWDAMYDPQTLLFTWLQNLEDGALNPPDWVVTFYWDGKFYYLRNNNLNNTQLNVLITAISKGYANPEVRRWNTHDVLYADKLPQLQRYDLNNNGKGGLATFLDNNNTKLDNAVVQQMVSSANRDVSVRVGYEVTTYSTRNGAKVPGSDRTIPYNLGNITVSPGPTVLSSKYKIKNNKENVEYTLSSNYINKLKDQEQSTLELLEKDASNNWVPATVPVKWNYMEVETVNRNLTFTPDVNNSKLYINIDGSTISMNMDIESGPLFALQNIATGRKYFNSMNLLKKKPQEIIRFNLVSTSDQGVTWTNYANNYEYTLNLNNPVTTSNSLNITVTAGPNTDAITIKVDNSQFTIRITKDNTVPTAGGVLVNAAANDATTIGDAINDIVANSIFSNSIENDIRNQGVTVTVVTASSANPNEKGNNAVFFHTGSLFINPLANADPLKSEEDANHLVYSKTLLWNVLDGEERTLVEDADRRGEVTANAMSIITDYFGGIENNDPANSIRNYDNLLNAVRDATIPLTELLLSYRLNDNLAKDYISFDKAFTITLFYNNINTDLTTLCPPVSPPSPPAPCGYTLKGLYKTTIAHEIGHAEYTCEQMVIAAKRMLVIEYYKRTGIPYTNSGCSTGDGHDPYNDSGARACLREGQF